MLEEIELDLRTTEADIARFENPRSHRPHDKEGVTGLAEFLSAIKKQYDSASWTSYEVEQKIKALESRIAKLRQE